MLAARRDFRGVTLIELLATLFIIAILALVSVPLFTTLITNYRLSTAADNLYFYLQYARSEAIKNNANVYVSFSTGDTWCYGINLGSACSCTIANNCSLATVSYSTPQQISLSTSGLSSNSIYFEGTHGAANAAGSITLTAYGQTSPLITVSVGRMGGLQVCSTGIGGYSAC